MIGQGDTSQLDVVLGRNAQLCMNLEITMALAELRAGLGENSFVIFRRAQRWLISGGPEFSRCHVAQIKKCAPAIAGRILAPASDGEIFPATVSAAGIADGDVVAAVGKKMNLWRARSGTFENPHDIFALAEAQSRFFQLEVFWQNAGLRFGKRLLKQQISRLQQWARHEAALHWQFAQRRNEREQTHPLMMRHVGTNGGAALIRRQT